LWKVPQARSNRCQWPFVYRSETTYAAVLGVLMAGYGYVPSTGRSQQAERG
jgi:hypothetical protein